MVFEIIVTFMKFYWFGCVVETVIVMLGLIFSHQVSHMAENLWELLALSSFV